jgi:hypothetical protein
MHPAANHDVLKLPSLDQVPHLALGEPDTRGELLRRLKAHIRHAAAPFIVPPAPSHPVTSRCRNVHEPRSISHLF